MPHNAYVVMETSETMAALCAHTGEGERSLAYVLHCEFVQPTMRVERALLLPALQSESAAPRELFVTLQSGVSSAAWFAQAEELACPESGAVVALALAADQKTVRIALRDGADWGAARRVALWAAHLPSTHWVEPAPHAQPVHNVMATNVLYNGPTFGNTPAVTPQYTGQGVTVGLLDTGVSRDSCYLSAAKISDYKSFGGDMADGSLGHGTAMAGTCCGNGGAQNGVAKDAALFVADLSTGDNIAADVDIAAALEGAKAAGATIGLVAFGDTNQKWYPKIAHAIDEFAAQNPNFLVVAAVGNNGYAGASAVAGPAYAKNALVVGATQNALESYLQINAAATALTEWAAKYRTSVGSGVVASFSSFGPTADGRRKPDVVAPGEYVQSATTAGCGVREVKGTSIAAAAVAGAAAAVSQYLTATRAGQPVTASLVKALVIHSAQEPFSRAVAPDAESTERVVGAGAWPSNLYGYGAVALDNVIPRQGSAVTPFFIDITEGEVGPGETVRFCFAAVGTARLRATLVWTDPIGSQMAGRALVNDLNLIAWRGADGFAWRGNHAEEYDSVNNVEAVQFATAAGQYGVAVTGLAVAGKQAFSLVVTGTGLSKTPCSEKCPVGCGASGNCLGGQCMCTGGAQGADCGALPCPSNCNGNGVCNTATATCACGRGWSGADCATSSPVATTKVITTNVKVTTTGIDTGLFVGLLVLAYFVGLYCFLFLGGFIGARLMQAKRDRQFRR